MTHDIFIILIFIAVFLIVFIIVRSLSGSSRKNNSYPYVAANGKMSPYLAFYKEVLLGGVDNHYLNTFLSFDGSLAYPRSWNWPASVFTMAWLIYRGMLGTAATLGAIMLVAVFAAPIKITLSLYAIMALLLGAVGSRYYHSLVKSDIDSLLATKTPDHIIRKILHQKWDSKISIFLIWG